MLLGIRKEPKMEKVKYLNNIKVDIVKTSPNMVEEVISEKIYKLTDEEVNWLNAMHEGEKFNQDKSKKEILNSLKRQLDILSKVQDEISIAFETNKIDVDEFMQGMCNTNNKIMEIIEQLKIESEYIPF